MPTRYRWLIVAIFFAFMLLHQSDKLLIGPLATSIMETFGINEVQMGAVFTGAILIASVLYPLWGYLYDRYSRAKLLALASCIWGATTWLSALAPTYSTFVATRASTGIDDSSYPGLYSLIADYFGPQTRGKIYGLLQLSAPLGYLVGTILALGLRDLIGWRGVFYITGSLGLLVAVLILFGVREAPRGRSEPELAELEQIGVYRFDRTVALSLFRKPTLLFLFAQGFFGVFPWNVIQAWFFRYLETERAYATGEVFMTMIIAVLTLAIGYFVGGALGDALFRRNRRGRLFLAMTAVLLGAGFLYLTLQTPPANQGRFLIWLALTAFFMPFAAPNVVSSIYDVTPPEVRSTALAIQYFVEQSGSATAPLLAGIIAVHSSLGNAILLICVTAWLLCAFLFAFAAYLAPHDIEVLRRLMRARAEQERVMQGVLVGSDQ